MAGFLRKKDKQDPVKLVPSAPIPMAAAAVVNPPLFARFATSAKSKTDGMPANQRMVSSPMVLSRKDLPPQRVGSRGNGHAVAAPTRDLDAARRRTSTTQNQGPNKTLPQIQLHSEQPLLSPPYYVPVLDKPLPPPIPHPSSVVDPSGSTPTQSFMTQSRGPPSAFHNQPQGRPRASLEDAGDRESNKQSFRTGSSQSFYPGQPQAFTMDEGHISNHASRPPTTNNNSVTSSLGRNSVHSNTNVGPHIHPPIANRKMQQNPPASFPRQILPTTVQTQTPHLSQRSLANQDLQAANVNGYNNMSMIGVPSSRVSPPRLQGTPKSDYAIDLPPEFALFHEFSQFNSEDRNSVHNEHVSVPRSSTYSSQSTTPRPSILSLPQESQDMGVASSHAPLVDFYSPRVRTVLYNDPHDHSHSPPMPPGAFPLPKQDVPAAFHQVPSNIPPRPSFQDLQQPVQYNLHNSGSSRKSVNSQGHMAPMKGKPRIFAAMAAQEDELNHMVAPPGPPQPILKKRPSQSTMYVQQPQPQPQPQPSALDMGVYTNGSDPFKDSGRFHGALQPQSQLPVPSTPKHPVIEQLPPTPASHGASRSTRSNGSRSILKDERSQTHHQPHRKLSKARAPDVNSLPQLHHPNGSSITLPSTPDSHHRRGSGSIRTLTKSRPTTPVAPPHKPLFASPVPGAPLEPAIQLDEDTISNAGLPLDDDPFARVEGVKLLRPSNSFKEEKDNGSNGKKHRHKKSSKDSSQSSLEDVSREEERKDVESEKVSAVVEVVAPPTPISPEEHRKTKKKKKKKQRKDDSQAEPTPAPAPSPSPPPVDGEDGEEDTATAEDESEPETEPEPEPEHIPLYTVDQLLSDPQILSSLLTFLSFYDWCVLSSLSKEIRILFVRTPELREAILERFLKTVGYSRWIWDDPDPLSLSLQDLSDYMRGVSTPTHEYARVAGMYVHSLTVHPNHRDPSLLDTVRILTASTRAYTRVILRLRAQAEKEAVLTQQSRGPTPVKPNNFNSASPARGTNSRVSSRAPSPTTSNYSHSHSHSHNGHGGGGATPVTIQQNSSQTSLTFRSPLFRLRRAPLLRVFVPSPEGDWLSDKSVLACEAECKRAGVMHLMRSGDVVWDVAVGDEGNVGRLVWDGSYLIDLDYTYSAVGDLPKYMPTLAFPPSYFHRVIRTGPSVSNPIVHIDISPWGEEIAMNLQLLQDRVRTETPQGAYHNVVRWVHRSSFVIRPPRGPTRYAHQGGRNQVLVPRIPIPDTDNLFVDSGWYGTIVVETEGTNEALADLQERSGPGAFPPRLRGVNYQMNQAQIENKKVFRILREKSRPSEIWIKAVGIKERLL